MNYYSNVICLGYRVHSLKYCVWIQFWGNLMKHSATFYSIIFIYLEVNILLHMTADSYTGNLLPPWPAATLKATDFVSQLLAPRAGLRHEQFLSKSESFVYFTWEISCVCLCFSHMLEWCYSSNQNFSKSNCGDRCGVVFLCFKATVCHHTHTVPMKQRSGGLEFKILNK